MNLLGTYRLFSVVPQGFDASFPFLFSFLVIFEALSWSDFEAFLFGIWWGCMLEPFVVLFPFIPLPNP
jgi:hypothetical protein